MSISRTGASTISGTAFPSSPADRQLWFRTDRDLLYFYDLANTRWLTVENYTTSFQAINASVAAGAGITGAAANAGRLTPPWKGTYSILITRYQVTTDVVNTNDGSNYWTMKLNWTDLNDNDTQIGSTMDTTADTHDQWVVHSISPNVVLNTSAIELKCRVDKVGTPDALFVLGIVSFRLVG